MYIYFFCIFIFVYLFIHCFGRSCEILRICPYSVQMRENTDQKKLRIWTLRAMFLRTARFLWKIHFCPKLGPFCNFVNFFSLKKWKAKVLLILDISLQTPCLVKFLFWSYCLKCSWPIRLQDSLKYNISKKMEGSNWVLCLQINIRVSYKLVLLLLVNVPRHVQSTQNNKFATSL